MATLLKTDGSEQTVYPPTTARGFTLKEVYDLIGNGCNIVQAIQLADGRRTMLTDEESKLHGGVQFVNVKATKLLAEAGGIPGDEIVGNVLLVSEQEFE